MEGCNVTILQPFIVSACRCLWLLCDVERCKSVWPHMSFIQMYRTHTHTHTTDLIPMPHAVDINMGNAPLLKRQSYLVFWILVQYVWRELKPGWDTRFIIAEAGLTFRHRASCILGQAFHYSPENAFYIFNQQIYFIIWYMLDSASLI